MNRIDEAILTPKDRPQTDASHQVHQTLLADAIDYVSSQFIQDDTLREDVNTYARGGAKTAALFLKGRVGIAATAVTSALDQIGSKDDFGTQAIDGALGTAKGLAMRGLFTGTEKLGLDLAAKAIALGTGSRLTENLMERRNYLDADGQYNLETGLSRGLNNSINTNALAADIFAFGLSHGLAAGANKLTGNAISNNRILSNVFTGGSFGFATGINTELSRQSAHGSIDLWEVARKGVIQAGVDAAAALPGGLQAARAYRTAPTNDQPIKPIESKPSESLEIDTARVLEAVERTDPTYLAKVIQTRTPAHRAGSYWEKTPSELLDAIKNARWEQFAPTDADGQPIFKAPAVGFRSEIPGGRLGMVRLDSLPSDTRLFLIDPHASLNGGKGNWGVSVIGAEGPKTTMATMILGPNELNPGKEQVLTFHPGDPIAKSPITNEVLGTMGIELGRLPTGGNYRRFQISTGQAKELGFDLAKIEAAENVKGPSEVPRLDWVPKKPTPKDQASTPVEIRIASGTNFLEKTQWTEMDYPHTDTYEPVKLSDPITEPISIVQGDQTLQGERGDRVIKRHNGRYSIWTKEEVRHLVDPRFTEYMRKIEEYMGGSGSNFRHQFHPPSLD